MEMAADSPTVEQIEDHKAFVARLRWCTEKIGSVYAMAKVTGINRTTLAKYVLGSEPTRPFLNSIARAAKVNAGWLATGEGSRDSNLEPAPQLGVSELVEVRSRFRWLAASKDPQLPKIEAFAKATEISAERLQGILEGKLDPSLLELLRICEFAQISPIWLLLGRGILGNVPGGPPPFYELKEHLFDSTHLFASADLHSAVARLLRPLNDYPYYVHRLQNDHMSPPYESGDILIADRSIEGMRGPRGTFIVSLDGDVFAGNVTKDGKVIKVTFNKDNIPSLQRDLESLQKVGAESRFHLLGRVVHHLSLRAV